jgi:hypothetical protein
MGHSVERCFSLLEVNGWKKIALFMKQKKRLQVKKNQGRGIVLVSEDVIFFLKKTGNKTRLWNF